MKARPNWGNVIPLLAVLVIAAIARIGVLLAMRDDLIVRIPVSDAAYYYSTAQALAEGEGWHHPIHFFGPVYPWLLSGLFRLAPQNTETVQWAQLLLGLGTTALVFLLARRLDPRAGLPAGLLYAMTGTVLFFENQILMESLLAFLLCCFIFFGGHAHRAPILSMGAAGLSLGLATAGRPIYLLLLPVLVLIQRRESHYSTWRQTGFWLAIVFFALVVIPPSLRNSLATGRLSFVTVSGGLNLYIGNNPTATGRWTLPHDVRFLEQDPTGVAAASRIAGRNLDRGEASRLFASRALDFMRAQPIEAAALVLRKAGYLISPDENPQIVSFDDARERYTILRLLGLVGFPLLLPLALVGATRRGGSRETWFLALAVLGTGALVHLIFFSTSRYRFPLLPALTVFAGAGVIRIIDLLRRRGERPLILLPLVAAVGLLIIAPRYDRAESQVWSAYQAGIRLLEIGSTRAAGEMFRAALEVNPRHGESWHNLAVCTSREGRPAEAIDLYRTALSHLGESPMTLYNLGVLHGRMGMDETALSYMDRSLRVDPTLHLVRVDRGVALYRLGRVEEAFAEWRRVAREEPGNANLHQTLARLQTTGVELPRDLLQIAVKPKNESSN
jgi:tetratricopeptide (TPR) repeat protein